MSQIKVKSAFRSTPKSSMMFQFRSDIDLLALNRFACFPPDHGWRPPNWVAEGSGWNEFKA